MNSETAYHLAILPSFLGAANLLHHTHSSAYLKKNCNLFLFKNNFICLFLAVLSLH